MNFLKKNKKLLSIAIVSTLALFQLGMHQTGEEHLIVRLALTNFPSQMKQLHALDMDIAGVSIPHQTVDVVVSREEAQQLRTLGFNTVHTKSTVAMAGPDAEYQTPDKIATLLQNYANTYPDLAQVMSVGKSLEGRDIYAIKITSHVAQNDPSKPHIFFNGMHHAREVMSVEIPLDTIDTLLTQYGKDAKVTHWVDANEIWVLPLFNVDGNNKVWTANSMWRKNTRGGYGVDINRNYPYQWKACNGSSGNRSAQDFRGDAAASEPETHVMMDLIAKVRPTFSISYHSYSELVLYPYGCKGEHTPTKEVVEGLGLEMSRKIISDDSNHFYTPGTSPEVLYSVDGSDIDWMYHEYSVIPYVIEVNSSEQGFQPSYKNWRNQTVSRLRPAWQLLLDKLDASAIHGQVKDAGGNAVASANIHIERISGGASFVQDYPARVDGYFHVVLPAGQYNVSASASTLKAPVQTVTVGATRLELPLILNP